MGSGVHIALTEQDETGFDSEEDDLRECISQDENEGLEGDNELDFSDIDTGAVDETYNDEHTHTSIIQKDTNPQIHKNRKNVTAKKRIRRSNSQRKSKLFMRRKKEPKTPKHDNETVGGVSKYMGGGGGRLEPTPRISVFSTQSAIVLHSLDRMLLGVFVHECKAGFVIVLGTVLCHLCVCVCVCVCIHAVKCEIGFVSSFVKIIIFVAPYFINCRHPYDP